MEKMDPESEEWGYIGRRFFASKLWSRTPARRSSPSTCESLKAYPPRQAADTLSMHKAAGSEGSRGERQPMALGRPDDRPDRVFPIRSPSVEPQVLQPFEQGSDLVPIAGRAHSRARGRKGRASRPGRRRCASAWPVRRASPAGGTSGTTDLADPHLVQRRKPLILKSLSPLRRSVLVPVR